MDKNSSSEQPVIDWSQQSELVKDTTNLMHELLDMFAKQLPEVEANIEQAFRQKDFTTLSAQVHKLQGACVYCGLPRVKIAASNINKAINQKLPLGEDLLSVLKDELAAVKVELKKMGILA